MLNVVVNRLEELRGEADTMQNRFHNALGAAGMRYAIEEIARTLTGDRDRLLKPREAALLSGYSRRQLRRMVREGLLTNHGRPRVPLYRASELPRKPGYRPRGAPGETPENAA
jgi:hypothetical protein